MLRVLIGMIAAALVLDCSFASKQDRDKCEGVVYNGKCYHLAFTYGTGVALIPGRSWCQFYGGVLAEIDSEAMYDVMYDYVQTAWVDKKRLYVNVLLGSYYEPGNKLIRLSNGNKWRPRDNLWHVGWPHTQPDETSLGFQVITGPGRSQKGFFNNDGLGIHSPVPLCTRNI